MRSRPGHDLAMALTLLTAVPVRVRSGEVERNDSASYFVLVGLLLGTLLLAVVWVANRFFYGLSLTGAVVVVAGFALLTRLMHWDGLADVADGWFVEPQRRLEVMSDSAVGAFGATAIALVALLQVGALSEVAATASTVAPVVLVPVCGRLAATFSAWLGKPAKPGGLGRSVVGRPTVFGVAATLASFAAAVGLALLAGAEWMPLAAIAGAGVLLALVVPHLIAQRFGGVTGDTMGASVMVVESAMLVTILVVTAVMRLLGLSA